MGCYLDSGYINENNNLIGIINMIFMIAKKYNGIFNDFNFINGNIDFNFIDNKMEILYFSQLYSILFPDYMI